MIVIFIYEKVSISALFAVVWMVLVHRSLLSWAEEKFPRKLNFSVLAAAIWYHACGYKEVAKCSSAILPCFENWEKYIFKLRDKIVFASNWVWDGVVRFPDPLVSWGTWLGTGWISPNCQLFFSTAHNQDTVDAGYWSAQQVLLVKLCAGYWGTLPEKNG